MNKLGWALSAIVKFEYNYNVTWEAEREFDGGEWTDALREKAYPKHRRQVERQARSRAGMSRSAFNRLLKQKSIYRALERGLTRKYKREYPVVDLK